MHLDDEKTMQMAREAGFCVPVIFGQDVRAYDVYLLDKEIPRGTL